MNPRILEESSMEAILIYSMVHSDDLLQPSTNTMPKNPITNIAMQEGLDKATELLRVLLLLAERQLLVGQTS